VFAFAAVRGEGGRPGGGVHDDHGHRPGDGAALRTRPPDPPHPPGALRRARSVHGPRRPSRAPEQAQHRHLAPAAAGLCRGTPAWGELRQVDF